MLTFETELKSYRLKSKQSSKRIIVQDFGAGSRKLGRERSIQSIYKTSVSPIRWQRKMYALVKSFESSNILEMGTSLGYSTVYFSKATKGQITTVEACPHTFSESQNLFGSLELNNVSSINSTFQNYIESIQSFTIKFDFVFIDGHHDGEALLSYVTQLRPHLSKKAVILVDDIRWSLGMKKAWDELLIDSSFSSKFDCFKMGILEFNRD